MKTLSLIVLLSFFFFISNGQKKLNKIDTVRGDVLFDHSTKNVFNETTVIYKTVNNSNKAHILNISKYLDTTKFIGIAFGGATIYIKFKDLRQGAKPLSGTQPNIFDFKIKNNQLLFTCTTFSIDGDVAAKIENNVLLESNNAEYASDKWIEVMGKNDFPILQIVLDKPSNSIKIEGVFFTDSRYFIMSDSTFETNNYEPPFLLMSQEERNTIFYKIKLTARELIKPRHLQ